MSSKVWEHAKKSMETDDKIQKTYSGRIDGKYGYLIITMKKVLFVKEEGLLSKSYTTTYNLSFAKMRGYKARDKYNLEFEDATGAKKVFVSEIPSSIVEANLNTIRGVEARAVPMT